MLLDDAISFLLSLFIFLLCSEIFSTLIYGVIRFIYFHFYLFLVVPLLCFVYFFIKILKNNKFSKKGKKLFHTI